MNNQTVSNRIWLSVVGDNKIGKTEAIFHFLNNKPQKLYFSCDKIISLLDRKVLISILEPSINKYSVQFLMRLSNSAIIYFYDVANSNSFTKIKQIYSKFHNTNDPVPNRIEIIVGNTKSLECHREISYDEAFTFAKTHNMNFFEISTLTGENIFECFYSSIKQAMEHTIETKKRLVDQNFEVQSKKSS